MTPRLPLEFLNCCSSQSPSFLSCMELYLRRSCTAVHFLVEVRSGAARKVRFVVESECNLLYEFWLQTVQCFKFFFCSRSLEKDKSNSVC